MRTVTVSIYVFDRCCCGTRTSRYTDQGCDCSYPSDAFNGGTAESPSDLDPQSSRIGGPSDTCV
ncbi:hypothetical protein SERLA73DRAFT_176565 [Serpula lacrymans var. lacrymans S7.3]|uniref:Uncharacterized protein n=1 Tax=Serpula lacrymans var. lacrymans (strain S7.3) TaxID=936435 RepID=F8PN65_SERL3|nr:hypothetical protein SERLA73DRAFT_176565 [Serpula lacrymans var. lacrymans S7.3]